MEVAGQWRREWSGTAEYGKVIEGGVTRQVARAMEVLHASAPGARVRVMRAAYHSSAGPGAPASSYMMHSSRQVISSGYNFLEPSSLPSKPLEISSTPLESSPDSELERENYKVTEPDDYDISEPSKWRASLRKNSSRMPSEESSSADNASIIDLDSRASSRSTLRRSNQNKENIHRIHNINTRVSPLLDAPVSLSTLKYTSLLNGSDDWNNRRKSYSFEGTSPIKDVPNENNSFNIDSSTDSGICKSTEIVNEYLNNKKYPNVPEKIDGNQEESFTEWLSRNRSICYKDITPVNISESSISADKIAVKSSGKVTITLPIESYKDKPNGTSKTDEFDRRTKKVEFCKTELHFAVDTGTVNIIATDEKPPPSNDFRKRRSAFVPLNEKIERPITLFGERTELSEYDIKENIILNTDFGEVDENTAATKGILKNKIPKPKPYLLGENMELGNFRDKKDFVLNENLTPLSAVSLINRQLQSKRRHSDETITSSVSEVSTDLENSFRTRTKGPQLRGSSNYRPTTNIATEPLKNNSSNLKNSILSQTENTSKIRELRGSELAYFGIDESKQHNIVHDKDSVRGEIFNSVKLVQQISNSVCNSEADSDDGPEYQNILLKNNFITIPTPTPRSKYGGEVYKENKTKVLKSIIEQDVEKAIPINAARSQSDKRNEPPKLTHNDKAIVSRPKDARNNYSSLEKSKTASLKRVKNKENDTSKLRFIKTEKCGQETPLYINLQTKPERRLLNSETKDYKPSNQQRRPITTNDFKINKTCINTTQTIQTTDKDGESNKFKENRRVTSRSKNNEISHETSQPLKKYHPRRTEKLITPDHLLHKSVEHQSHDKNRKIDKHETHNTNSIKRKENKDITKVTERNISKPKNMDENNLCEKKQNIPNITKSIERSTQSKGNSNENKISMNSIKDKQHFQYGIQLNKDKTTKNSNTKPDKPSKSKRSKYVINYDDKNGTVSSICKIKSVPGTYTRKLISVENKIPQEHTNNKTLNKIAMKK